MPDDWSTAEAPGQGEEEDLFAVCVSCQAAEGTMERADGQPICADCHCAGVDYAIERARRKP